MAVIGGILVVLIALAALPALWQAFGGYISITIAVVVPLVCLGLWRQSVERRQKRSEIEKTAGELLAIVPSAFQMEDCPVCHESEMRFISVSPNARSIKYQCINCDETMHGAACSGDAQKAKHAYQQLVQEAEEYRGLLGKSDEEMKMSFNSEGGVTFSSTERSP